ncbi:MAG: tetratricopeptide repeat protein [Bacteroidia bacterium]
MNPGYEDYPPDARGDMDHLLAYIYGDLPETEASAISREIDRNIGLRMMVSGMIHVKEIKGFASWPEHREWLDHRKNTIDGVLRQYRRSQRNQRLKMSMAFASVVLFIVYLINLPLFSSPKLYKKYQTKPEIAVTTVGQWPLQNPATFTNYYTANQYLQVLEECNRMLRIDSTLLDVRLYAGFCYLELNDPDKAMEQFSRIIVSGSDDEHLCSQAIWQSGLAYIKAQDFERAIQVFDTLATTPTIKREDGRLAQKARKILWRAKVRNFVLQNIVHRGQA